MVVMAGIVWGWLLWLGLSGTGCHGWDCQGMVVMARIVWGWLSWLGLSGGVYYNSGGRRGRRGEEGDPIARIC